jgi:hypothetical protein
MMMTLNELCKRIDAQHELAARLKQIPRALWEKTLFLEALKGNDCNFTIVRILASN